MVSDHQFQQLTKLGLLFLGHVGVGWAGDALCVALLPCVRWARLRSLEPLCMLPCHCIGSDHLFQQLKKLGVLSLGHFGVGWRHWIGSFFVRLVLGGVELSDFALCWVGLY